MKHRKEKLYFEKPAINPVICALWSVPIRFDEMESLTVLHIRAFNTELFRYMAEDNSIYINKFESPSAHTHTHSAVCWMNGATELVSAVCGHKIG